MFTSKDQIRPAIEAVRSQVARGAIAPSKGAEIERELERNRVTFNRSVWVLLAAGLFLYGGLTVMAVYLVRAWLNWATLGVDLLKVAGFWALVAVVGLAVLKWLDAKARDVKEDALNALPPDVRAAFKQHEKEF